MLPPPEPIARAAALAQRNDPRTLTANMRSHSARSISSNGRRSTSSAALLTSPSTWPAPANSDSTCSASLTSQTTSAPGRRSAVTTSAPRARSSAASAAPMPRPPPVTTTRLPATVTRAPVRAARARERVVDAPVRRQHVGQPGPEVERPAVERLDPPARLGDQQGAGADVPRVGRVGLQEGVDAAGGDVRQAQRRRADAPNAPATAGELGDALSERGDRPRIVGLHAGAHERLVEGRRRRDVQPVARRAMPLRLAPP